VTSAKGATVGRGPVQAGPGDGVGLRVEEGVHDALQLRPERARRELRLAAGDVDGHHHVALDLHDGAGAGRDARAPGALVPQVAAVDDEDRGPPGGGQRHLGGVAERQGEADAARVQRVADVAQALEQEGVGPGGGLGVGGRQARTTTATGRRSSAPSASACVSAGFARVRCACCIQ
jgi:hypothetical protein